MQKVKDRKAKLQEKRETRDAELQQIEQAEQQKQAAFDEANGVDDASESDSSGEQEQATENSTNMTTTRYQDTHTTSQFGGQVIVTTSTVPPIDDDDEHDESSSDTESTARHAHKNVDSQQRYAGNVNKYINELKGKMPGKKKNHFQKHKGRHGAASMKGMGGAANLKVAQKALSKIQAKQHKHERKGKRSKRHH